MRLRGSYSVWSAATKRIACSRLGFLFLLSLILSYLIKRGVASFQLTVPPGNDPDSLLHKEGLVK